MRLFFREGRLQNKSTRGDASQQNRAKAQKIADVYEGAYGACVASDSVTKKHFTLAQVQRLISVADAEWEKFCVVEIGGGLRYPRVHQVLHDHYHGMFLALDELWRAVFIKCHSRGSCHSDAKKLPVSSFTTQNSSLVTTVISLVHFT